jgi:hypothetical protein
VHVEMGSRRDLLGGSRGTQRNAGVYRKRESGESRETRSWGQQAKDTGESRDKENSAALRKKQTERSWKGGPERQTRWWGRPAPNGRKLTGGGHTPGGREVLRQTDGREPGRKVHNRGKGGFTHLRTGQGKDSSLPIPFGVSPAPPPPLPGDAVGD